MNPEATPYDSRIESYQHIALVSHELLSISSYLMRRAQDHDATKLINPERRLFDTYAPLLRETTYDSPQYREHLRHMGAALEHHYAYNRHHPEHFRRGIHDMTLLDMIEMLADWKAAVQRHADGDLEHSIKVNADRFGYGPEITGLLLNTARARNWI